MLSMIDVDTVDTIHPIKTETETFKENTIQNTEYIT